MTKMLIRHQVLIKYLTESYNTVQQRYIRSSDITSNINFIQLETSGNLPEDWLTANISPMFKKGIAIDHLHSTVQQLISLTAVCCKKILEHIIYISWSIYYSIK